MARFLPSTVTGRVFCFVIAAIYIVGSTLYTNLVHPFFTGPTYSEVFPSTPDGTATESTASAAPSRVLIVTSWFPVQNLRFTEKEYAKWLPYFFGSNKNHIYLYTTPEYESKFRSLRGPDLPLSIDTRFASPFDIPPLKGKEDSYRTILKKDKAKRTASIDLYANRHAKPFFLYDAILQSEKKYDFAFWSDAGSFREEHVYTEWPSSRRLQDVWELSSNLSDVATDDLVFIPSSHAPHPSMIYWTEQMGPIDNDISIASFFGGPPKALDWFTRAYYAYHDHYLSLEIFIGKNQALINSLLFLFPERFSTVWANEPDSSSSQKHSESKTIGQCGKKLRFYYEFWLARSEEREKMREMWIRKATSWWWGWWKRVDKTPCKMKEVLGIEQVLRSKLGSEWKPPSKSVVIPENLGW